MRLTQRAIIAAAASTLMLSGCFLDSDSSSPASATTTPSSGTPTTPPSTGGSTSNPTTNPSTNPTTNPSTAQPTTLTGTAMAGPVKSGNVCAYTLDANGVVGTNALNCSTTDNNGGYTLSWNSYNGSVLVKITSGSYVDEATGSTRTITTNSPLRSTAACPGTTCGAAVTPLTELAVRNASNLTSAELAAAYLKVAKAFGVNAATTDEAINQLVTRIPSLTNTDTSARTYAQLLALVSGMQNTKCGSTCDLDNYLGTLKTLLADPAGLAAIQADFSFAFNQSNSSGVNGMKCSLKNAVMTCDLNTSADSSANGNYKLSILVNANGIATPAIVINNIAKPSTQDEFCSGAQVQDQINQLKASNQGTWTLNSCSFSGNSGTISATISMTQPIAISIPYTINYTYSSM